MAGRRPTIVDVAERAGVSRQTVSRAMNDMAGISPATRSRVLEAAKELSYRPSRFGRGLVEQGPITVGLVVQDLSNAYFAELGAAVVRACVPYGWNVVLAEADNALVPEDVARELARRVDAIVGYGMLHGDLRGATGMPVVRIDGTAEQCQEMGIIELVFPGATADLVAHLRRAGVHRPVVMDLAGDAEPGTRARALAAALAPLAESGEVPIHKAHDRVGHVEALQEVLEVGADALVAFNDELAVRLLRALRTMGVEVPGRLRVVGLDGLEIGSLVTPELTTLSIDIDAIAAQAVALVAGMLEGRIPLTGQEAHRVVPYRLEVRASA
ncbi:LacI family DNA-binding transcriptional regulator [Brachybacterium sp. YJGR34]|uniref:LacI family DNA-binding transcriptional regulator n=1 Tax=Brachybacterium sp. YJGR34 TaxID=2059911 RepID=UPI001E4151EB|nr:LacI family DNA-binding transcriptional regulator [Brachybacterium sp. YJGR34]